MTHQPQGSNTRRLYAGYITSKMHMEAWAKDEAENKLETEVKGMNPHEREKFLKHYADYILELNRYSREARE